MKELIRLSFYITALFWILSPMAFVGLRLYGLFNFQYDWAIGLFLVFMQTACLFFSFQCWRSE